MHSPDLTSVSLHVKEKNHALQVDLHNHRTTVISKTVQSLGADKAPDILRSLLGLCPIAQVCAFEAAREAATGQTIKNLSNRNKLITAEAVLETIRVLSMDLQPFTIHGKVSPESLRTIGELRGRLWELSKSPTQDNVALENFLADLKALVILWFAREKIAINAIKHTFERFDDMPMSGQALLFPEEIHKKEILKLFVNILQDYPDWAVSPQWAGARIPGALARIRSVQNQGRRNDFRVRVLVLARLEELKNYASSLLPAFTIESYSLEQGWGAGVVETARGTLMHFLRFENGQMQYHIVAPTEWAFQEESPMVEVMNRYANKRIGAVKSIVTGINLIACAFDPCTRVTVQWPQKEV